ncbi:sugar phosphate nucleotidyltransferase [Rahnella perminowiae]|uniref:phosphocholine cytidylyltransferase family protein n=1 Tax=Rahnella perminowiae TaxID=2816244 RepID=UPI00215C9AB0|nr:sugar phosphate nucleotidyltransferase [Rahnella perminowiae]MCR9002115.1 sugar phosphate nucleotidyltransferase [Rahnella perminowiae]
MKAIILAAGLGSRLRPITNDRPKAMVTMLEEPTLFRTIKQLMDVGIKEVTIVVGYKQEMVIKEINKYFGEGKIKFIKNEIFGESGTALSFYLAAKETDSDVLMLEGDVLFETQLLKRIVGSEISNNIAAIARFCPLERNCSRNGREQNNKLLYKSEFW